MSALHPKKKQKRRKGTSKEKEIYVIKGQVSDSYSTVSDPEDSRRPANKSVKWLIDF